MPAPTAHNSRFVAWCQLVRLPNLLTVPGDPLAGFLIAGAGSALGAGTDDKVGMFIDRPWLRAGIAVAAALLLYMRGLITNDVFDLPEDLRDRPHRPLPSGRIHPRTAFRVASLMGLAGIVLAMLNGVLSGGLVVVLVLLIWSYNRMLKKIPSAGPVAIGLCRAVSLLLGAAAAGWYGPPPLAVMAAAATLWLYVAGVSTIAARETETVRIGPRRWGPLLIAFAAAVGALALAGSGRAALGGLFAASVMGTLGLFCLWWGWLLGGEPTPRLVQMLVGRLIGGIMLIQAATVCLAFDDRPLLSLGTAMGLIAGWLVFTPLARRFHAS